MPGVGPQLLCYLLPSGKLLNSCSVFEGVRIHGIRIHDHSCGPWYRDTWQSAGSEDPPGQSSPDTWHALTALHGERSVKILQAVCRPRLTEASRNEGVGESGEGLPGGQQQVGGDVQLALLQELPRFSEWVLDARLLPVSASLIWPRIRSTLWTSEGAD